jgi:hypothetical protein
LYQIYNEFLLGEQGKMILDSVIVEKFVENGFGPEFENLIFSEKYKHAFLKN